MIGFLKGILVVLTSLVLITGTWMVTPSSLFLRPISIAIDGTTLTFIRETPYGDTDVIWHGQITLLNADGFECSGNGRGIVQQQPNDLVQRRVSAWMQECVAAGPPYVIRYEYQVMLFGLIPLRPVGISGTMQRPLLGDLPDALKPDGKLP